MNISPPVDWSAPQRAFLIASSARSGSTLLMHIMRRVGIFGWPEEYFNRPLMQKINGGGLPSAAACFSYASKMGQRNGVLGIKFIAGQLHFAVTHSALEEWLPKRCWILLRRRDIVRQAVSYAIAIKTGLWSSLDASEKEPIYDTAAILRALVVVLEENAYLSLYFALRNENIIELIYEDFEHNYQRAVDSICKHFDIEVPIISEGIALQVERQYTLRNEEWRERFLNEMHNLSPDEGLTVALMISKGMVSQKYSSGLTDNGSLAVPRLSALARIVGAERAVKAAYAAGQADGERKTASEIIRHAKESSYSSFADELLGLYRG